jgi:hypothetical protein
MILKPKDQLGCTKAQLRRSKEMVELINTATGTLSGASIARIEMFQRAREEQQAARRRGGK